MKFPKLVQLLGTLAIAPVFAISYALHAHADPPGSHAGRVSHQTAASSIAAARRSGPTRHQTPDFLYPGARGGGRMASIARTPTLHAGRGYDAQH